MSISANLAELNYQRYQAWQVPFTPDNASPAVLLFQGDVYLGLRADLWRPADYQQAQGQLRILSGLYGLLRPLDLIQPYRLEMGTKLKVGRVANLYQFWQAEITQALNEQLAENKTQVLLNLASNEYAKSIDYSNLKADVVTPKFKDWKNGEYKMIGFFAKKARGMLASWCIQNKVTDINALSEFNGGGYAYSTESTPHQPVYLRRAA